MASSSWPPEPSLPTPAESQSSVRNASGSATKRIKIDIACNFCRIRKSKCDGIRPSASIFSRRLFGGSDTECCSVWTLPETAQWSPAMHVPARRNRSTRTVSTKEATIVDFLRRLTLSRLTSHPSTRNEDIIQRGGRSRDDRGEEIPPVVQSTLQHLPMEISPCRIADCGSSRTKVIDGLLEVQAIDQPRRMLWEQWKAGR